MSGETAPTETAAARLLVDHQYDGVKGRDWDAPGGLRESCTCGWEQSYAGHNSETRRALWPAHLAAVLVAAGLLRPDPTGEDREAVRAALAPFTRPARDFDGFDFEMVSGKADDILSAVLAPRPRGPVTETPSVGHEFLPVEGHPDDDECTYRSDGTDATYCGEPASAHAVTETPAVTPEQVEAVRDLHGKLHRCTDGWYWNPTGALGASLATQGPCPTMQVLGTEVRAGEPR